MIEREENNATSVQENRKTTSSEFGAHERDSPGHGGASTVSKSAAPPAFSPNTTPSNRIPHGEFTESMEKGSPDRSAFDERPSQRSIIHTEDFGEKQMRTERRPASITTRHEVLNSHPPGSIFGSQELASSRDLEKLSLDQQCSYSERPTYTNAQCASSADVDREDTAEDDDPTRHAMKILIFLSTLAPALSLATCLYTTVATLLILVLSPFCLCTSSNRIRRNFQRFLVPPLSLQLKAIYSDFDEEEASRGSKPLMLILVNFFAPVYAMGICIAAWIAAGFWFFAAILGDPNVKDKTETGKDDDGKTTVMTVRYWWERWLIRGLQ